MSQQEKPIRFASLIRVSTEKQEKQGESLNTQKKQIGEAVQTLRGVIAKEYGGQEHATEGWEKRQLESLLRDASQEKPLFDAVIVQEPLRWSRDNGMSKKGLQILRDNGIRFFCSTQEFDLFDPQAALFLGMAAEMGEFQARSQKLKSLQNRIERAKRIGAPTGGKPPFGRIWDKEKEQWEIDETKRAMVLDVASRYLAGESMAKLADEYGINHASLHKTITKRCGDKWTMRFRAKDLNIDEEVTVTVPRLLPEEMIQAIHEKTRANKTFEHGQLKNQYLLGRVIFCEHCGCAMFGQSNHQSKLYYRHHRRNSAIQCEQRKTFIPAELIEEHVIRRLFEMFGNVDHLVQAMRDAVPNIEEMTQAREQEERLVAEIEKIEAARDRVVNLIVKDKLTEDQAEKQLDDLKEKESRLKDQLTKLTNSIDNAPSLDKIERTAFKWRSFYQGERSNLRDYSKMTFEQKRALVQLVFSGKRDDGSRMGVYVTWQDEPNDKFLRWRFSIHGHLIDGDHYEQLYPHSLEWLETMYDGELCFMQHEQLLQCVTKYASH